MEINKYLRSILLLSVCLFVSVAHAKLQILGDLPQKPLLYQKLLDLNSKDLITGTNEKPSLGMVHNTWIKRVADSVVSYQNGTLKNLGVDIPVEYFSQNDARDILKPLLHNLYGIELRESTIKNLFKNTGKYKAETNYETKYNILRMERVKAETFRIANKLFDLTKGNMVVSIGHTPLLLMEMLRSVSSTAKPEYQVTTIQVPFSGRADLIATHRPKRVWSASYKNIITESGEQNYRNFLSDLGFSPSKLEGKKIYLVDDSRGPALAAFLLFLTRWYRDEGISLPDINFASMRSEESLHKWRQMRWKDNPPEDAMNLKISEDLKFKIDTTYLDMESPVLYELLEMQDNVRILPSMNAINWSLDLHKLMAEYPRPYGKRLLDKYSLYATSHAEIQKLWK